MIIPVPMERVLSTSLGAYGYEAERQVLAVQFKNTGVVFHYAAVPLDKALEFGAAESKGKFFASEIKGKYPARRVTGPCRNCKTEGYIGQLCTDCGTDQHYAVERREESGS